MDLFLRTIHRRLKALERNQHIMAQTQADLDAALVSLTSAISTLSDDLTQTASDLGTALADLVAKIAAAGTPIDLTSEVAAIQTAVTNLGNLATQVQAVDATAKSTASGS